MFVDSVSDTTKPSLVHLYTSDPTCVSLTLPSSARADAITVLSLVSEIAMKCSLSISKCAVARAPRVGISWSSTHPSSSQIQRYSLDIVLYPNSRAVSKRFVTNKYGTSTSSSNRAHSCCCQVTPACRCNSRQFSPSSDPCRVQVLGCPCSPSVPLGSDRIAYPPRQVSVANSTRIHPLVSFAAEQYKSPPPLPVPSSGFLSPSAANEAR
mmetsp:Transcript_49176/g.115823  ORF Transcript_49176/g.115823 Transcript_49176/m.115823 type:complete len:210 (-) Transcript_49176:906-1535(-)